MKTVIRLNRRDGQSFELDRGDLDSVSVVLYHNIYYMYSSHVFGPFITTLIFNECEPPTVLDED